MSLMINERARLEEVLESIVTSLRVVRDQSVRGAPGLPDAWIVDASANAAMALHETLEGVEEAGRKEGGRVLAEAFSGLLQEAWRAQGDRETGRGLLLSWSFLRRLDALLAPYVNSQG